MGDRSELRVLGTVKWFNNKTGYGFLTVLKGEHEGKDIFVHHSGIETSNNHYKYLVQGEYVSFDVNVCEEDSKYDLQAVGVTGVCGNVLMCETKYMQKDRERHNPRSSVDAK